MNRFGFGAMRLPLINPDDKQSIDMDELKRMVDILSLIHISEPTRPY